MTVVEIISIGSMVMIVGILALVFDYGRRIDDEELMLGIVFMIIGVLIVFILGRLS